MKRALRWSMSALLLALLGAGILVFWNSGAQLTAIANRPVTTLRGATQAISITATPVSAVGAIDLISKRQVVLRTSGAIANVAIEVGDTVKAGDLLVALETQALEWAVEEADIGLENARINLEQASEAIEPSDIALAEAQLLLAKENLAVVEAGPTAEQLAASKASAAAAWANYNDVKSGPTPEELTQASAALKNAEITRQQAQRAYDKIAWQPDAGASSEGAALQRASIEYESAKAAYDELVKPASTAELQSALADAQSAQDDLNELEKKPTPAELADAKANVADAEAALAKLKKGTDAADIRAAELGIQSAQIALEQAKLDLTNARVNAPVDGVVLAVNVELGQNGSSGTVIAEIADTAHLRMIANVEQKDIRFVMMGQPVEISVYGLGDQVFHGEVDKIAPQGNTETGSISFPVTIRLTDESLANLRPGMSATATFLADQNKSDE